MIRYVLWLLFDALKEAIKDEAKGIKQVLTPYLRRALSRQFTMVLKKEIEGVYICYFEDKKWRVAAATNIIDIQDHTTLPMYQTKRDLTQYQFIQTFFQDAYEFDRLSEAVEHAHQLLKVYPNTRDGIALFPGEYKTPFKKIISARARSVG